MNSKPNFKSSIGNTQLSRVLSVKRIWWMISWSVSLSKSKRVWNKIMKNVLNFRTRSRRWREPIKRFKKIRKLLRTSLGSVVSLWSLKSFYTSHSLMHMRKFLTIISDSKKRSRALNRSLLSKKSWTQFCWSICVKIRHNLKNSYKNRKCRVYHSMRRKSKKMSRMSFKLRKFVLIP